MEKSYPAFMEGVGALVMGSKTYEFILDQEWAYADLPVWVMTSRDLPSVDGAAGLRFAAGSVAELHDEMIDARRLRPRHRRTQRARILLEERVRDPHPDPDRHSSHHGRSSESGG